MKRLLCVFTLAAVVLSCKQKTDGAVQVTVTTNAKLKGDCFILSLSKDGTELAAQPLPLTPGHTYFIGVKQEDRPAVVNYQALAYFGDCEGDAAGRKLSGRSDTQQQAFPKAGVNEVSLALNQPDSSLDADGDGYVAVSKGGNDCDDANDAVHPGKPQSCGLMVDDDCDGKVGCADSDCTSSPACQHPPTLLALTPTSVSVQVRDCSAAITVETRDATGLAPATLPLSVALSTTATGVTFYSDTSCSIAVTTVTVAAAQSSASFFLKGLQATLGATSVTARSTGLTDGTMSLTVTPTPAVALALVVNPSPIVVGECSSDFTIELRDGAGQPTVMTSDTGIGLSTTPTINGGAFFAGSDLHCTNSLGSPATITLLAGQPRVNFKLTGSLSGTYVLTAQTAGGLMTTDSVTLVSGGATKLVFGPDPGPQVNVCSGVQLVQLEDSLGNLKPSSGPTTVSLSVNGSGANHLHFYSASDATCTGGTVTQVTIADGTTDATFRLMSDAVGTYGITGQSVPLSDAVGTVTIANGPPDHIKLLAASPFPNTQAGSCSSLITVQTQDNSNAPSAVGPDGGIVTFGLPGALDGSVTLYSDVGCNTALGTTVPLAPSTASRAFYFKTGTAQTFALDAGITSPFASNDALGGLKVVPAIPSRLVWQAPLSQSVSTGVCTAAPYSLLVQDLFGNPTTFAAGGTLTVTAPAIASATFTGGPGCVDGGATVAIGVDAGTVSFYAIGTTPGSSFLTVTSGSVGAPIDAGALTVTAGAVAKLVFTVAPQANVTTDQCTSAFVQQQDAFNNPVTSPLLVSLLATPDGGTDAGFYFSTSAFNCDAGVTVGSVNIVSGQSTVPFFLRGTVAGLSGTSYAITARDGAGHSVGASQRVMPGATKRIRLNGVPASASAGGCVTTSTVQRFDQFGNPTPEATALSVTLSSPTPNFGFVSLTSGDCMGSATPLGVTILANTDSVGFSFQGTTATTAVIDAGIASPVTFDSKSLTIIPGLATRLVFTDAGVGTAQAGVCAGPVGVQAQDLYGNAAPSVAPVTPSSTSATPFTFFTNAACSTPGSTFALVGGAGSFYFSPILAPEIITLGVDAGAPFNDFPSASVTVSAGAANKLVWKAGGAPPSMMNHFACSGAVTVQVLDSNNNLTTSGSVRALTLQAPAIANVALFASNNCSGPIGASVGAGASEVTFSLRFLGQAGVWGLTATAAGLTVTPASSVTVTGPQGTLELAATLTDVEYLGCQPVTVTRKDDTGTLWTSGASTAQVSVPTASIISLDLLANCTSSVATSVTPTFPDGQSAVTVYARGHSGYFDGGTPASVAVSASDPTGGFAPPTDLVMNALPLVRRATCVLPDTQSSVGCAPLVPPIIGDVSRTLLVFQAVQDHTGASDSTVACSLSGAGAAVQVNCSRYGTNGAVTIAYQTATWGRDASDGGVTVQHLSKSLINTDPNPFNLPITAVAATNHSFLLFSSASSGSVVDQDDFVNVRLQSASNVRLTNPVGWQVDGGNPGFLASVQVVQMAGLDVQRGNPSGGSGATINVGSIASGSAVNRLLPLHSISFSSTGDTNPERICKRRYRGTIPGSNQLTSLIFTRGNTNGAECTNANVNELSWERLDLPAGCTVQYGNVNINGNTNGGTLGITAVGALHRTLVLLSGQGPGGQAAGETTYNNGSNSDNLGFAEALVDFSSASQVSVTRPAAQGGANSQYTPFVVEFAP